MRHQPLLERMQAHWKLCRGLGTANLLVIHRLTDLLAVGEEGSGGRALAEELLADCPSRVIHHREAGQLHAAAGLLGHTRTEAQAVAALTKGHGLWRVADRSFIAQHTCDARLPAEEDTREHRLPADLTDHSRHHVRTARALLQSAGIDPDRDHLLPARGRGYGSSRRWICTSEVQT